MLGRGLLRIIRTGAGRRARPGACRRGRRGLIRPGVSRPGSAGSASTSLTALPATSSIIYTASLTVRTTNLTRAAAQATQMARAAGGYVSSENTRLDRAHPDRSTVSLQLKIPVSAYQATLGALSTQTGTRLAMSQHAEDVTQTVADVTSRVTSDQAAISQLRALLRHAGSVSSLLTVQNQINDEESSLESLLARQRALTHETSFGTVDMLLVAPAARAGHHGRHQAAGGFVAGLRAGWHGLVRVGVPDPDRGRCRAPVRRDPGRARLRGLPRPAAGGSRATVVRPPVPDRRPRRPALRRGSRHQARGPG